MGEVEEEEEEEEDEGVLRRETEGDPLDVDIDVDVDVNDIWFFVGVDDLLATFCNISLDHPPSLLCFLKYLLWWWRGWLVR